jgi:hypothetical protein
MSDSGASVHPLPKRKRNRFAQWPITIVFIGIGISLILIATDHFRRGSLGLAASVLLAAFLRLFLPNSDAGMLEVRSKRIDVAVLGALGVILTIFALWVPAPN